MLRQKFDLIKSMNWYWWFGIGLTPGCGELMGHHPRSTSKPVGGKLNSAQMLAPFTLSPAKENTICGLKGNRVSIAISIRKWHNPKHVVSSRNHKGRGPPSC